MSAAPVAPGKLAYVVSTGFGTQVRVVGWQRDKVGAEAARIRAARQADHDQRPKQPEWFNIGQAQLQVSSNALSAQIVPHPSGLDGGRRRDFVVVLSEALDASTWWTPA